MIKKILLVEDDPNKLKALRGFLDNNKDALAISYEWKMSFQSGLDTILSGDFDLILLDMSMHNFEKSSTEAGGEFMKFAGEDILREMIWSDIKTPVIVVTQYDLIGNKTLTELKDNWQKEFGQIYADTVFYSSDQSKWQNELLQLIKKALK